MFARLKNVVSTPGYVTGTIGNVVLVDWRKQPTKAGVQMVEKVISDLLAENSGKIGLFVVTRVESSAPDAEARDGFAQSMKDHADRIYGSTMTIEGGGLRAAANRAVLTAITLLGDISPIPKVCGTIDEAAASLVRMSAATNEPGTLAPSELTAAFSELRSHLASHSAV